jgi:uncharacterized membrane protein
MSWYHPSSLLDKIFEGGIIIKGLTGVFEFLSGLFLLFVSPPSIQRFLARITGDSHSWVAYHIRHAADHFGSGSKVFAIGYLWVHAVIKLIAVYGILRNKLWAYPFALITLGMLMLFQVYSIIVKVSIGMVLLTVFDIFILGLIWREYGKAKIELGHES